MGPFSSISGSAYATRFFCFRYSNSYCGFSGSSLRRCSCALTSYSDAGSSTEYCRFNRICGSSYPHLLNNSWNRTSRGYVTSRYRRRRSSCNGVF